MSNKMENIKMFKAIMLSLMMVFALAPAGVFSVEDNNNTIIDNNSTIIVDINNTVVENNTVVDDNSSQENSTVDELENENSNENSIDELVILSSDLGAKVRLLQLEKKIEDKIEDAQVIIDDLKEDNSTNVDIEKLNEVVAQLENLLLEIEGLDLNQSANILAQEFVAVKDEATNLIKEFRDEVKNIDSNKKEKIKSRIEIRERERLSYNDSEIESLKMQYNAEKVNEILNRLGIDGSDVVEKVENGEMRVGDAVSEIVSRFGALSDEEKVNALLKFREEKTKQKIELEDKRSELKLKADEKKSEIRIKYKERKAHSFDDSDELEIEVEFERGFAKVEIESNGFENRFRMQTTNIDEVIDEIVSRTDLTKEEINAVLEVDYDDSDELEVEVEFERGFAKVEVELNGFKNTFRIQTTNIDEVIDEIVSRTDLTKEEIKAVLKVDYDDSSDSNDDSDELEIEVEVERGFAKVEIESNGQKSRFNMNSTDKEEIIDEIVSRTELKREQIKNAMRFKVEDDSDDDSDNN